MSLDPEALPPKGELAEKLVFTGRAEPSPTINGSNYFSGEFNAKAGTSVGLIAETQPEWEQAWAALGKKPPGRLPDNARAVIEAAKFGPRDPAVSFVPMTIDIKPSSGEILIDWKCIIISKEEDKDAKPRYAVVLLPAKGKLRAQFNDVWPVRERKKRLDQFNENVTRFGKGASKPLPAPSKAEFKRRNQMKARRN